MVKLVRYVRGRVSEIATAFPSYRPIPTKGRIQRMRGTRYKNSVVVLAAIQKVVFDDKLVTLPQLIEIMDRNWKGREDVRQACLNAPKFGNDDDYVDSIANEVYCRTQDVMFSVKDRFGRGIRLDGSGISATYGLAGDCPATPDGRIDGYTFADSSNGPAQGMDKKGPTAVLNSCQKIDPLSHIQLLNQKFSPELLKGDMKPIFMSYLKTWQDKNICHIQFNAVDKETLIDAQLHQEKHRDLIVRVAGFSAYFVDLSRGLQDSIIARTEQRFGS